VRGFKKVNANCRNLQITDRRLCRAKLLFILETNSSNVNLFERVPSARVQRIRKETVCALVRTGSFHPRVHIISTSVIFFYVPLASLSLPKLAHNRANVSAVCLMDK
jgi:hypothetical protein